MRADFSIDELIPEGTKPSSAEVAALLEDSRAVKRPRQKHVRWALEPSIRRQVLAALSVEERLGLLPSPGDAPVGGRDDASLSSLTERMLGGYLRGDAPSIDQQSRDELAVTARVLDWLEDVPGLDVPPRRKVDQKRRREELLAPFRSLTSHFQGRARELERLRRYVGWLPSSSITESAEKWIRSALRLHEKPPLMIQGVGGSGKTTLLAKFILDHLDRAQDPVAFLYFDFDLPVVSIREPLTLVVEGLRQLALQVPEHGEAFEAAAGEIAGSLAATSRGSLTNLETKGRFQEASGAERQDAVRRFAGAWAGSGRSDDPLLLVLDSFEEAQARQAEFIPDLFSFLELWVGLVPRLRIVIAGRAEIAAESFPTDILRLGDFDESAAVGFLRSRGIERDDVARRIYDVYRGNPLVLHLAAELVAKEPRGDALVREESLWSVARYRLDAGFAQRVLFQRNLSHIADPEVRKLAFPGLAVRRLSARVIEHVLAKPCGVDLGPSPADRALELLDRVRREAFLVSTDDDGELRYRSDLRRMMLPTVEQEEPDRTRLIHDRAVEHYGGSTKDRDRAEAIYHRLMRQDDPSSVEPLLTPDVKTFLEGSSAEMPPRAQLVLARRYGWTVPPDILASASLEDWELQTAAEVDKLLESGQESAIRRAEERLARRALRSVASPLFLREATVRMRLGNPERARSAAQAALAVARRTRRIDDELAMLFLLARVEDELELQAAARAHLREAHRVAVRAGRPLEAARAKLDELSLLRRTGRIDEKGEGTIVQRISSLIGKLDSAGLERIAAYAPSLLSRSAEIGEAMAKRRRELGVAAAAETSAAAAPATSVLPTDALRQYASKLRSAVGSNVELEEFLKRTFDVHLREFTAPGSLEFNVFETVRFAERPRHVGEADHRARRRSRVTGRRPCPRSVTAVLPEDPDVVLYVEPGENVEAVLVPRPATCPRCGRSYYRHECVVRVGRTGA